MKKLVVSLLVLCFATLGLAGNASAEDVTGKFGVGIEAPLSQTDKGGLHVTYYLMKWFGIRGSFGMNFDTLSTDNDGNTNDQSAFQWNVGIHGLIPMTLTEKVNLTAFVGATIIGAKNSQTAGGTTTSKDYVTASIDLGLRPEWFVTKHLSLHTAFGMAFLIKTKDYVYYRQSTTPGSKIKVSGAEGAIFSQNMTAQAGVTFWFN